jgi:hypothetical protein
MNPSSKCAGVLSRRFSSLAVSLSSTSSTANKSFSSLAWKLNNSSIATPTTKPTTTTHMMTMMMMTNNTQYQHQQQRTKVSNRKVIDAKNAKRLKIQQKKKKGNGLKVSLAYTVVLHYITSVFYFFIFLYNAYQFIFL